MLIDFTEAVVLLPVATPRNKLYANRMIYFEPGLLTYLLTYSMEQSPSSEANRVCS